MGDGNELVNGCIRHKVLKLDLNAEGTPINLLLGFLFSSSSFCRVRQSWLSHSPVFSVLLVHVPLVLDVVCRSPFVSPLLALHVRLDPLGRCLSHLLATISTSTSLVVNPSNLLATTSTSPSSVVASPTPAALISAAPLRTDRPEDAPSVPPLPVFDAQLEFVAQAVQPRV